MRMNILSALTILAFSGCVASSDSPTNERTTGVTTTETPDTTDCSNAVKAEAVAAADRGEDYDYVGELGRRCGVIIDSPSGDETPPTPEDPATAECANEVKAEALAAEAQGIAYDYAGQLSARCGIVLGG